MRRSGRITLALLAAGALAVVLVLLGSLRQRLYAQHVAAAEASLSSIGAILSRAHGLGEPLGEMVGLEELLQAHATAQQGIVAVRVLDAAGRVVWRDRSDPAWPAKRLEVALGGEGRLQAGFVAPSDAAVLLRVAAVLLVVAGVLALPLWELVRLADLTGEQFPDRLFERQLGRVRNRDLRLTWRLAGVTGDVRLRFLRDQVFLLNEQYQRGVHLMRSLQRTEPDAGRRGRLGELLETLHARFRFIMGGPIDRPAWPAEGTARCFAALTVLLANLSVGGGGNAPYSPAAAPYSAALALLLWSAGLLAGALTPALRWPLQLRAALGVTVLANLLMLRFAEWSDLGAHLAGGFATALAAAAALGAARADPRRTAIALLIAGTVVGPVLGLAATAALSPFGHVGWLYGSAATLALLTGVWLSYQLPDDVPLRGRAPAAGLALEPLLAGIAWSAAIMACIAQVSVNREEALRRVVLMLPGLFLLAGRCTGQHRSLAVGLVLCGGAWLLSLAWPAVLPAVWPSLAPAVGAACLGGALAVMRDRRHAPRRTLPGFAAGAFGLLAAVAATGRLAPQALLPLELWAIVVAVAAGQALPWAARRNVG